MSNGKFNKIGVISARCLCENIARLTNIKGTNQTPPLLYRVSLWRRWNVRRGIEQRGIERRGNVQRGIVTKPPDTEQCR